MLSLLLLLLVVGGNAAAATTVDGDRVNNFPKLNGSDSDADNYSELSGWPCHCCHRRCGGRCNGHVAWPWCMMVNGEWCTNGGKNIIW